MNINTPLSLLLSFIFMIFSLGNIQAQKQRGTGNVQPQQFSRMTFEQQRNLVYVWKNQSSLVQMPADFEQKAKDYYSKGLLDEYGYNKNSGFFRPLFNEEMQPADRVNYCTFLLDNFTEADMPLSLIRETKASLLKRVIK